MKTVKLPVAWSLVAPILAALWCFGCATVPITKCDKLPCASFASCFDGAEAMLAAGQPDAAYCYYKRALDIRPDSAPARMGLATTFAVTGEAGKARRQFRLVEKHSRLIDERETARSWIEALDSPVPIAVFFSPAEGCDIDADDAARYAARLVRHNLPRFGAFRSVGKDIEPVSAFADPFEIATRARQAGARLGIRVWVTCVSLEHALNPSYLGGLLRIEGGADSAYTVRLDIEAYSVASGTLSESFFGSGSARNLFQGVALLSSIDKALANCILRISTRLMVGP